MICLQNQKYEEADWQTKLVQTPEFMDSGSNDIPTDIIAKGFPTTAQKCSRKEFPHPQWLSMWLSMLCLN